MDSEIEIKEAWWYTRKKQTDNDAIEGQELMTLVPSQLKSRAYQYIEKSSAYTYIPAIDVVKRAIYNLEHTKLHREDGPALEKWDEFGNLTAREYYVNGLRHREDGPAVEHWENNMIKYRAYYINGHKHREDGPAIEEWYGIQIVKREYYVDNGLHRTDGAASKKWSNVGVKMYRAYCVYGRICSYTSPALTIWNKDGIKIYEIWCTDGNITNTTGKMTFNYPLKMYFHYHCESGPAYKKWNDNGQLIKEEYYSDNMTYTPSYTKRSC